MIDINKIPIVNPAQLEKFLEGSVKVEMEYSEIYKKNKKNKVTKLKTIIDNSLENVFWVSHQGKFLGSSDYPQEFEQKYGNISYVSLAIEDYLFDKQQLERIHEFLRKWNFDVTQQYKINEYNTGYYFCDDLTLMVRATFGMPEDKIEKEDDDGDVFTPNNGGVTISFSPLVKNRKMIEEFLKEFVDEEFLFLPASEKSFYMIAQTQHGLTKQKTSFKNIPIKDDDYSLYYGDDFPHEKILKFFEEESNNLMVFYGHPGCGKTNYIKNLITHCDEDVIYVPPSMVNIIAEPSFVSFMLQNQGNVLIVEDAEQILCGDRSTATTNILNLTDGFLKDSLKLKIIATMNADIRAIDDALLRKGRLHLSHHFDKLSTKEANRLSEHCGIEHTFTEEIPLCDIFNLEEFESPLKKQERALGFGNF
jgi:hypothetical protein